MLCLHNAHLDDINYLKFISCLAEPYEDIICAEPLIRNSVLINKNNNKKIKHV